MRIIEAVPEAKVLDTYSQLARPGDFVPEYSARGAYLDHITRQEIDAQLLAGLPLWFFGFAKQFDGAHLVGRAKLLGVPLGATIGFDVEAITDDAPTLIGKLDPCAKTILNAGYLAMGYFGAQQPLTSDEMSALVVTRYSRAGSKIRDRFGKIAAPERGWCHLQYAPQYSKHGVTIDDGRAKRDYRGDVMTWITL